MGLGLTTHELVRTVDTVGEGVALLLDEDALAAGAPELVGQANGCKEGVSHSEASAGLTRLPALPPGPSNEGLGSTCRADKWDPF